MILVGVSFSSSSSGLCFCDKGKTKSAPYVTWTGLLDFDWSLTTFKLSDFMVVS